MLLMHKKTFMTDEEDAMNLNDINNRRNNIENYFKIPSL